jgi:hypothetical protein
MSERASLCADVPFLDQMGAWNDDMSVAWLPVAYYPTRGKARQMFDAETGPWGADWTKIRVVKRYVKPDPNYHASEGLIAQCAKDDPEAFPVWRVESPYIEPWEAERAA